MQFTRTNVSGHRELIRLGTEIGRGGAGKVYEIKGNPKQVAKLYDDRRKARTHLPKLRAMLLTPPNLPIIERQSVQYVQIAWPEALLHDSSGEPAGFCMPRVPLTKAVLLDNLLQKITRIDKKLPEDYGLRIIAATNLASIIDELNKLNHHMIDMKPSNLFVYRETMYIAAIDCDGLSIHEPGGGRYPAPQFSNDYICPECGSRDPADLGEEQDRFALAVIIFQLMNNGLHPYQGIPVTGKQVPTETQERINAGLFAYGSSRNSFQLPSPQTLHTTFEDETRHLFERAFTNPGNRPSAGEWRKHLTSLVDKKILVRCTRNQEHAHFSKGCGLCALETAAARKRRHAAKIRTTPSPQRAAPQIATGVPGIGGYAAAVAQRNIATTTYSNISYLYGGVAGLIAGSVGGGFAGLVTAYIPGIIIQFLVALVAGTAIANKTVLFWIFLCACIGAIVGAFSGARWLSNSANSAADARMKGVLIGLPALVGCGLLFLSISNISAYTELTRSTSDRTYQASQLSNPPAKVTSQPSGTQSSQQSTTALTNSGILPGGKRIWLDRTASQPQIVRTSFTGGAHCCTVTEIDTVDSSGNWHTVDGGSLDGDVGYEFIDLDRNGVNELVSVDNSFLYAFDCYACSYAPTRIAKLVGTQLKDVTWDTRYRDFLLQRLQQMEIRARNANSLTSNGYLAGWVATKALVDELEDGWRQMLSSYNHSSQPNFPQLLTKFLVDNGYITSGQTQKLLVLSANSISSAYPPSTFPTTNYNPTSNVGAHSAIGNIIEVHNDLGYVVFESRGVSLAAGDIVIVQTSSGGQQVKVQKHYGTLYSAVPQRGMSDIQIGNAVSK